jgi:RluA family pseudouridine synthase
VAGQEKVEFNLVSQRNDKRPPPKRGPRGLPLLHEDKDILVVDKPAGLLTVGSERDKTRTAHYLLNDYVRKGDPKSRNRVYVVHRLDQDTSGILLFAKSEEAKRFLQDNWGQTDKHYLAIVQGRLSLKEGTITSSLVESTAQRVYSTPDTSKGKLSHTAYKVLQENSRFSLVEIHLLTGRKHQIRVHFAGQGHPVAGDKKYGNGELISKRLALHARSISFTHPFHGRKMTFDTGMPEAFVRLLARM